MEKRQYLCGMITLARHIELLLLDHDCVIVPGLGGFIANHADASYSGAQENLLLPPYRTIGFNQQLQVNDGLLIQSYMTAYDTSYPFASLQMEKDLEKMLQELELKGEYTLENIGTLKKGINNNITFIAPESGVLTPSLYGLYSCEIKSLSRVIKEREVEQKLQTAADAMHIVGGEKEEEPKKHKDVIIRLNRRWLDFSISVAAAAVLLFCFSYPAMKNMGSETDTVVATFTPMHNAPIQTTELAKNTQPATTMTEKMVESGTSMETEAIQTAETSEEQSTARVEDKQTTNAAKKFSIVLASYVSETNANTFIKGLTKAGYPKGKYVKKGKVSRILYSEYATEAEAQNALKTLRQQNTEFAKAWILEL